MSRVNPIITFDDFDMQWINLYSSRIDATKVFTGAHSKKHDVTKSEFELTYIGTMGEYAASKYFCSDMDMGLHRGGDNGTDLIINGQAVHLKTTNRYGVPLLILDSIKCFTTKLGMVAKILSPIKVELCGLVSRTYFYQNHSIRDFGYGNRLVMSVDEMVHVDRILEL